MIRLENIIKTFKSTTSEIKAFLHRQKWREVLVFLSFVLLAFGFWLLQSLQEEYEMNISIPIRYRNIPPEISFTQTPPNKVIVRVKDKGSVLLNYTFGPIFGAIDVNMKNSVDGSGTLEVRRREIEGEILKQLMTSTTLVTFEPSIIEVTYSTRINKSIPVKFNGNIHTSPGFAVSGRITLSPPNVEVYASDALLDSLKEVQTVFTDIKNVNKTVTRILQLQKIPETEFEPGTVSVTIPIEEFTEKTLDIPIEFRGIPENFIVRAFPSSVKVNAYVPLSRFKDVEEEDFAISISFYDLEQNDTGILPITLSRKPDWIQNITLNPDKIEFILEQKRNHD